MKQYYDEEFLELKTLLLLLNKLATALMNSIIKLHLNEVIVALYRNAILVPSYL